MKRRSFLPLLVLVVSLGALPAVIAKPGGADRALAERARGASLPLDRIVRDTAALLPGHLLEAEIDDDDGRLVYELKWLLPDGRRLDIEIDAASGTWLELKGQRLESAFRKPLPKTLPR